MNYFLLALQKYAQFSGRSRRSEYWFFFLFYILLSIGLAIADGVMGFISEGAGIGLLSGIFALGMLIPSLSVGIRRLHDTGRSGWWLLISIIPIFGVLILLFFSLQDSEDGSNEYGDNPKKPVS